MNRNILLIILIAMILIVSGCKKGVIRTYVDASSIPDQSYDVTVYRGPMARSYAVLFDIPDDGVRVFMKHTSFTEKIGLDSSRGYIDEFRTRIKRHRTVRISGQDGEVRGYLLASNLLNYVIQPAGVSIMVSIEDPYLGYLQSAP